MAQFKIFFLQNFDERDSIIEMVCSVPYEAKVEWQNFDKSFHWSHEIQTRTSCTLQGYELWDLLSMRKKN